MSYTVLDISKWNPIQDYAAAAKCIDGVIIKCAYRGYSSSGTLAKDPLFDTHYNGFKDKGIPIGVYLFTQAINTQEGIEEANYIYNIIKNLNIKFPIYIDTEKSNGNGDGRADNISNSARTDAIIGFCDRIRELGYRAGIYASDSWFINRLDWNRISPKNYSIWNASYSYEPYRVPFDGWQYTSNGSIDGYNNRVDLSHFYKDVAGWEDAEPVNPEKIDISLAHIEPLGEFKYMRQYLRPELTITYGSETLVEGTDYTTVYSNNANSGTATATANGIGKYTGSISTRFTITPVSANELVISLPQDMYTYNGYQITPEPIIKYNNMKIVKVADYDLEYIDNVEVGRASILVSTKGNFYGNTVFNFTITSKSIRDVQYSLESNNFEYSGSQILPEVIIEDNKELVLNQDYNLLYSNNINIGTGNVQITGIGNYSDEVELSFVISPKNVNNLIYSCGERDNDQCYNIDNFKIMNDGISLVQDSDYLLSITEQTLDEYKVANLFIQGKGNYTGTKTISYEIEKIGFNIEKLNVDVISKSFVYSGAQNKPKVNIWFPNELRNLVEETDYTISYENNINAGTGTGIITGINDFIGSKIFTFNIEKLSILNATVSCGDLNEDGYYDINNLSLQVGDLNLLLNRDFTFTRNEYPDRQFVVSNITITAIGNYSGRKNVSFKTGLIVDAQRNMSDLTYVITPKSLEYNTHQRTVQINIYNGQQKLVENIDYTVQYLNNVNAGTATIIISGDGILYLGSIEKTFEITKSSIDEGSMSCGLPDEYGFYNLNNILISAKNRILEKDIDYTLSVNERREFPIIVSEVIATGTGNYLGTITNEFRTGKFTYDINEIDMSLSQTEFIFNNNIQVPDIISTITENIDYNKIIENSKNAGTYNIIVNGIDNYSGTRYLEYNITPRNINDATVDYGEKGIDECYKIENITLSINNIKLQNFNDYQLTIIRTEEVENKTISYCRITGIGNYTEFIEFSIATSTKELYSGKELELNNCPIYSRYCGAYSSGFKSGKYFIWNDSICNNRIRITNKFENVKQIGFITGWVPVDILLNNNTFSINDRVIVNGNLNSLPDGSGNSIYKQNEIMYIVEIRDESNCKYALASGINRTLQGWATEDILFK